MSKISVAYNSQSGGSAIDISNYYLGPKEIPRYAANDDFSPIVLNTSIDITEKSNINFLVNDIITFTLPGTVSRFISSFIITKKHHSIKNHVVTLELESPLRKLSKKFITKANLDQLIKATSDPLKYKYRDNRYDSIPYNFANIQLVHLLQCMFVSCGMTLTVLQGTEKIGNWNNADYTLNELCIDYEMLWSLNQTTTGVYDEELFVTYLDFLQAVSSLLGITVYQTSAAQYELHVKSELYSPACTDDILYDKDEVEVGKKNEVALCDVIWSGDENYYYDTTQRAIETNLNTSTSEKTTFSWIDSLRLMLRAKSGNPGDVTPINLRWIDPLTNYSGLVTCPIRDNASSNYSETNGKYLLTDNIVDGRAYDVVKLDYDVEDDLFKFSQRIKI